MKLADIKTNSIITIKDDLTIDDCLKQGKGINGLNMSVTGKKVVREQGGLCSWHFFQLEEGPQEDAYRPCLVVKVVSDIEEFRIYESPEWYHSDNRMGLHESGILGELFAPSRKRTLDLLENKKSIVIDIEGQDAEYIRKMPTLYGETKDGGDTHFTCVTEYATSFGAVNPEILVLETGGVTADDEEEFEDEDDLELDEEENIFYSEDDDEDEDNSDECQGGHVELLLGRVVKSIDLEIL